MIGDLATQAHGKPSSCGPRGQLLLGLSLSHPQRRQLLLRVVLGISEVKGAQFGINTQAVLAVSVADTVPVTVQALGCPVGT